MLRIPNLRARNASAARCELVKGTDADTLYVYGVIGSDGWGDGIAAKEVATAVQASTAARLNVRINSPGGDVFEGVAMAQALRSFSGEVTALVDGLAASAATLLTAAADKVLMAKGSMLMIHRAWTIALGNSQDLLEQAALLEKIDGQIANAYADKAGIEPAAALALMDAETWFTEEEAVAAKFADGLQDSAPADTKAALRQWDLSAFAKAPAMPDDPKETLAVKVVIDASAVRDAIEKVQKEQQDAARIAEHERATRIARMFKPESA